MNRILDWTQGCITKEYLNQDFPKYSKCCSCGKEDLYENMFGGVYCQEDFEKLKCVECVAADLVEVESVLKECNLSNEQRYDLKREASFYRRFIHEIYLRNKNES